MSNGFAFRHSPEALSDDNPLKDGNLPVLNIGNGAADLGLIGGRTKPALTDHEKMKFLAEFQAGSALSGIETNNKGIRCPGGFAYLKDPRQRGGNCCYAAHCVL
jgi:hypothetical protein